MKEYSTIIIGGGPAGLAASLGASENKIGKCLLIERNNELGGILNQCIHEGFGLHYFNEELTGPEYAERFINMVKKRPNIEVLLNTNITQITKEKEVTFLGPNGLTTVKGNSIIITTGCFERSRAKIFLPGKRLAGIMTAGVAQKFVNINGYLPGEEIVIIGSGDIGLIMARRLSISGAKVKMVIEINQSPSGLARNIKQCLSDFNIPLLLGYKVVDIMGSERLEKIIIAKVDDEYQEINGTREEIMCDTLLLSVGLIPYNKLFEDLLVPFNSLTNSPLVTQNYETTIPDFYLAGNNLHVNDLVDNVSTEAMQAGLNSYQNYQAGRSQKNTPVTISGNINYIIPSLIDYNALSDFTFSFRVKRKVQQAEFMLWCDEQMVFKKKLTFLVPQMITNIKIKKEVMPPKCNIIRVEVRDNE